MDKNYLQSNDKTNQEVDYFITGLGTDTDTEVSDKTT